MLQREVRVSRWRVVATLGFSQKRPEIIAILALAGESPNGIITAQDVSRKLLADRPAIVGERLLQVCNMMRLVRRAEPGGQVWQLTELGRQALTNQDVPSPQRGEFEIWAMEDDLHPEVLLRVKPTELERQPKNGEQKELAALLPLPAFLKNCQNRILRPPVRLEQEAAEIFVFEFEDLGRTVEIDSGMLSVEITSTGGNARFTVEIEGRREFTPVAQLPALSEALNFAGRADAAGPQRIAFRTLSDSERRQALREICLEGFTVPGLGSFSSANLRDVPIIPLKQEHANEWAVWRVLDQIKGYVWAEEYERFVRSVRELAVKEGWEFDPVIPTQKELAGQLAGQMDLVRKLLVPLDWQALAQPEDRNTSPIVILSGQAARGQEAEKLLARSGNGSPRIYLMETIGVKSGDGLPYGMSDGIRDRAIIRRVREAPDAWVWMEGRQKAGQRWQPAQKPKSEPMARTTKLPPKIEVTGTWHDLNEIEFQRLLEDLKTAFWRRPVQEFQPDGTWVAVKSR